MCHDATTETDVHLGEVSLLASALRLANGDINCVQQCTQVEI